MLRRFRRLLIWFIYIIFLQVKFNSPTNHAKGKENKMWTKEIAAAMRKTDIVLLPSLIQPYHNYAHWKWKELPAVFCATLNFGWFSLQKFAFWKRSQSLTDELSWHVFLPEKNVLFTEEKTTKKMIFGLASTLNMCFYFLAKFVLFLEIIFIFHFFIYDLFSIRFSIFVFVLF